MWGEKQEDNNEIEEAANLWMLDWGPIAAVTNYYTFSGLKEHRDILLQFWRPQVQNQFTGLKSECGQGWFPLESLEKNPLPCLF